MAINVDIRPVRPHEARDLYRCYRETVLVAYEHIFPPDLYPFPDDAERKTWRRLVTDHGHIHRLFVAESDGAIAGAVVAKPGTLQRLFVLPRHWGTGVADALLAAAIDVTYRTGAQRCRLEVLEANHRARRFYERHGWVRDHRSRAADHPPHPIIVGYTYSLSR